MFMQKIYRTLPIVLITAAVTPTLVVAQGSDNPVILTTESGHPVSLESLNGLLEALQKKPQNYVTLSLKKDVLDAKTSGTTLTITNSGPDTLDVTLAMRPNPFPEGAPPSAAMSDTAARAADAEAGDAAHSLTTWVTGLPKEMRLLPNATQNIELQVKAPTDARTGRYLGWVVAVSNVWLADRASGVKFSVNPQVSTAKLAYQVK